MSNVKVKICGIRSVDAALAAAEKGANFIGLNFVPTSKRLISIENAQKIAHEMKGNIKIVGIFMNQPIDEINRIAEDVGLDYVQLHGDENVEFITLIQSKVIKTFALEHNFDIEFVLQQMNTYNVDYFLVDRNIQGKGAMLDVEKIEKLSRKFPIFVAGGLNSENVANIVKNVSPFGVDVAGGIETDCKEDINKIQEFIDAVKKSRFCKKQDRF